MTQNQTQTKTQIPVYAYTQHIVTVKAIEEICGQKITLLTQDRTRDPVDDVLRQLPQETTSQGTILYAVMPIDKVIELKQKAPQLKIRLLQLDGSVVEKLTGKPYDPKAEYPADVIRQALKFIEIKQGTIRYYNSLQEMIDEVTKKGFRKIGIFNDTLREGLKLALQRIGRDVELVKTCNSSECVEVNPLGTKSGVRISFPGTAGKLTPEQMAEMITTGAARIYYAEVTAEEVPLCP